jgi:hypothetical protein
MTHSVITQDVEYLTDLIRQPMWLSGSSDNLESLAAGEMSAFPVPSRRADPLIWTLDNLGTVHVPSPYGNRTRPYTVNGLGYPTFHI